MDRFEPHLRKVRVEGRKNLGLRQRGRDFGTKPQIGDGKRRQRRRAPKTASPHGLPC
jgi:hypothetical protein